MNADTTAKRTSELEGTLKRCSYCRAYAEEAVQASIDNILYDCGLTGALWSTSEAYHFDGCMTNEVRNFGGFVAFFPWYTGGTFEQAVDRFFKPDTGDRAEAIAKCKLTHQRRDCVSCHISNSVSAETIKSSRSSFQSLPKGASPGQSHARRPPLAGKNSNSSGNDLAHPSGGTVRRAANPCRSATAGQPCNPGSPLLGPGLLEGGQGFSRQGPGAAGAHSAPKAPAASPLYSH